MKGCKKLFRTFVKCHFWNLNFKEYSTTLDTHKILKSEFSKKKQKKQKSETPEGYFNKNKVLELLSASELKPYINWSKSSLLRTYVAFKPNCSIQYSFVVDSAVAKSIVDTILPELMKERSLVIEGNPGLGLITLHLLKSQVPEIHLYESTKLKNVALQQLINEYSERIQLKNHNIFLNKGNQLVQVLDNALELNMCNKIIGVIHHTQFLNNFVRDCIDCFLWKSIENTNFFFIVSKTILQNVIQNNVSRHKYLTYCFYNLIFKTDLLEEYPSSAFLPYSHSSDDKMFLVKISKRPNFPGNFTESDIKSLLNLCKILGRSKFNYIIPTLEEWIPECGPYLISKGISITNQINDLSFEEFEKLYLFLRKHKGFKNFKIAD